MWLPSLADVALVKPLLQAFVKESEAHGIWTLQAGIFPENVAQHHASPILWIPEGWRPVSHRQTRRHLERCSAAGTPESRDRLTFHCHSERLGLAARNLVY